MAKSYQWVERGVYGMLNAFRNDGSVAAAEAFAIGSAALTAAEVYDAAYPPADVRKAILDQEIFLIGLICRSVGHPARGAFELRTAIAHRDALPQSYSSDRVFEVEIDGVDVVSDYRSSAGTIDNLRNLPEEFRPLTPYHNITSNVFYCTHDDATMIHYGLDASAIVAHAANVAAKFDSSGDNILLPDEFVLPLLYFATAQLAMTGDSDAAQAGSLTQMGQAALSALGIAPAAA